VYPLPLPLSEVCL